MQIGNPGQPAIPSNGIIFSPNEWCSIRVSCMEDYVYYQKFRDEFQIEKSDSSATFAKLRTQAGLFTINIRNRLDLYTILGTSKLELNREINTPTTFSWGLGGKLIIFKAHHFLVGIDGKYFEFNSSPSFLLSEGLSYNVAHQLTFKYSEIQAAFGISYKSSAIIPYINVTYLIAKIEPNPMTSLVIWPIDGLTLIDVDCNSVIAQKRWGLALGATLLDLGKATFAVETRMFNQNGIDATLEIRF